VENKLYIIHVILFNWASLNSNPDLIPPAPRFQKLTMDILLYNRTVEHNH